MLVTLQSIDVIMPGDVQGAPMVTWTACMAAAMRALSRNPEHSVHVMQKPRRSQWLPETRESSRSPSECQMRWTGVRDYLSASLSWAQHAPGQSARQQYLLYCMQACRLTHCHIRV